MKKRLSEEQIIGFLQQAEAGVAIKERCRQYDFSDASCYNWRVKFSGMSVPELAPEFNKAISCYCTGLTAKISAISTREQKLDAGELARSAEMIEQGYGQRPFSSIHLRTDEASFDETSQRLAAHIRQLLGGTQESNGCRTTPRTCCGTFATEDNRSQIMKHAGEILILTGPPGSGKTTTAQALAEESGSPKVHLHSDDFWHFIKNGAIPPYLPEAHEQNTVVMDVLAGVAEGYAKGGYFVVVDGIIGPWFLQPFETVAAPLHYVVLRPPLDVAILRCQERGGDTLTDPEPITALHQQFSSLEQLERHVLPTDGRAFHETLGMVIEAVESGKFRLAV